MSADSHWQPRASAATLRTRAQLLQTTRDFFTARNVLEVTTPTLVADTVSDPHTHALRTDHQTWLRTSPEYHLKRLLAAHQCDVYEIGPVFRADEAGSRHQPEFTLLEWYRIGMSAPELAEETAELINSLLQSAGQASRKVRMQSYAEVFSEYCGFDPLTADLPTLRAAAERLLNPPVEGLNNDRSEWLDALAGCHVFPQLGQDCIQILTHYPADQAMLAQLDRANPAVAQRFEVFVNGLELANGYGELTDAEEQATRFNADNELRRQRGLPAIAPDERLLAALEHGLPECAGVALGFDRLLMLATGEDDIGAVLSFLPGH